MHLMAPDAAVRHTSATFGIHCVVNSRRTPRHGIGRPCWTAPMRPLGLDRRAGPGASAVQVAFRPRRACTGCRR